MRPVSLSELLELHRRIIEQSGGADGVRDLGLAESALAQPQMSFGGNELYPTLAGKAAALCFSLVLNHPFVDGNKRIGHAAMETFLVLNGFELNAAVDREYPVSGNLSEDRAPYERLESHIQALLRRHFGEGISWQLERLRSLEYVNPTGLVDDILSAHHGPNRKQMLSVLGELLGEEASGRVIRFYETSALALCRGDWSNSSAPKSNAQGNRTIGATKIKVLARQITQFLFAGIEMNVHLRDATSGNKNRRGCNELSE